MEVAALGSRTLRLHRQLLAGGEDIPLGKRALDVISMLAQARGKVVTKDELMEAVWPGVIVEENALQAQIVALRKALGPEADRLKTIRGIGYRLDLDTCGAAESEAEAKGGALQAPWESSRKESRWWSPTRVGGLMAVSVALAGGAWTILNVRTNLGEMIRVQALSASGGAQAQLLARSLDGEIVNVLNQSGIETHSDASDARFSLLPQPDWQLGGRVLQNGARLAVDVRFEDVPTGTVLWSRRFEGDEGSLEELATQASAAAARTIYAAQELRLQKNIQVDPAIVALHLRASELVRSRQLGGEGTPRQIYERIVAREPELAHAHAVLALSMLDDARNGPPEMRSELRQAIRREASKAIEIDPAGAGAAYDALYSLSWTERPRDFTAAERWLLEGLRNAPGFAFLWMRECRFLMGVGRAQDALPYCQRALALHPYAEPIGHSYASVLWATRDYNSARDAIDRAAALAPDHLATRSVRFELAAFGGDKAKALGLLADPSIRPEELQDDAIAVLGSYLRKRDSPGSLEALAARLFELGRGGEISMEWTVMALTSLGDRDRAFALLRSPGMDESLRRASGFLFRPVTRPLRADPRFWPLAAELGLARYWKTSDKWPDMCRNEFALSYCKSQVEKAQADR